MWTIKNLYVFSVLIDIKQIYSVKKIYLYEEKLHLLFFREIESLLFMEIPRKNILFKATL